MKRVAEFEAEIARLKNRPNSKNSSLPPSADITRQNKRNPNRKKSGIKPGGRPGHKGNFLEMRKQIDETIKCLPDTCATCGKGLENIIGTAFIGAKLLICRLQGSPIMLDTLN